jgi:phage I-like protein
MNKKMQETNKQIAFPISLFAEGKDVEPQSLAREIHIVPTGKWSHPYYGEFEITPKMISQMCAYFKEGVRKDIPITPGHDNGMSGGELPAVGWFKELIDKGVQGLYAWVEWTAEGEKLLREKAFKYFSAEISWNYYDSELDIKRDVLLVGGALTNKPFFKQLDLDPAAGFSEKDKDKVTFSFEVKEIINQFNETNIMDLKTILAKKVEELSAEEKAYVVEHKSELSAEEAEAFKSVVGETAKEETPEEKTAREAKEKEDADAKAKADTEAANVAAGLNPDGTAKVTDVSASEKGKKVELSEAEHIALKKRADAYDTMFAEVEKNKVNTLVGKLVLSESNKAGRFAIAQKGAVESFVKTLSETQRDQLVNLVNAMPKKEMDFSEKGDAGSEVSTGANAIAAKADEMAKAKVKASEGKLKYSDALKQVFAENPQMNADYEASSEEVK